LPSHPRVYNIFNDNERHRFKTGPSGQSSVCLRFASVLAIDSERNRIIVTTTDFGNSMMLARNTNNTMYGSYTANTATAKTYMYMINFDGTFTKITIQ